MKRRHAIAGMVFSLLVGVAIAVHDAGLVRWSTPGAHEISVVRGHIIAMVRGVAVWWKNSKIF